jgi:hypothetical protein
MYHWVQSYFCVIPPRLTALVFQNGDILSGKLITATSEFCTYLPDITGDVLTIKFIGIKEFETQTIFRVETFDGEKVIGTLKYKDNKFFVISSSLGSIETDLTKIERINEVKQQANTDSASANDSNAQTDENAVAGENSSRTFGQEEETAPQTYLIGNSILLEPGEWQLTTSLGYTMWESSFYKDTQHRTFSFSLGVDVGILPGLEGWINLPLGYNHRQDITVYGIKHNNDRLGLMDISGGLNYQLMAETDTWPELVLVLSGTVPTGKESYSTSIYVLDDCPTSLGSGHWGTSVGLNFTKASDPAVIYGGIGVNYLWPAEYDDVTYKPGIGFRGHLGVGFALNNKLSFNTRIGFSYRDDMKTNDYTIDGSNAESWDIALGFSYRMFKDYILQPLVIYSINDGGGAPSFSLSMIRKF